MTNKFRNDGLRALLAALLSLCLTVRDAVAITEPTGVLVIFQTTTTNPGQGGSHFLRYVVYNTQTGRILSTGIGPPSDAILQQYGGLRVPVQGAAGTTTRTAAMTGGGTVALVAESTVIAAALVAAGTYLGAQIDGPFRADGTCTQTHVDRAGGWCAVLGEVWNDFTHNSGHGWFGCNRGGWQVLP